MIQKKCWILSAMILILMVFTAEIFKQKEIIFPEVMALLTGTLLSEKMIWKVSRLQFIVVMALAAFAGTAISQFMMKLTWDIHVSMLAAVLTAYLFVATLLIILRSTFLPAVSACVLPVLLKTESLIYPLAVTILAIVIIAADVAVKKPAASEVGDVAEKIPEAEAELGGRTVKKYELSEKKSAKEVKGEYNYKTEIAKWGMCLVVLSVFACVAISADARFMIAPPLIVVLLSFASYGNKLKQKSLSIFLITVVCAVIGAAARYVTEIVFSLPLTVAACVVVTLVWLMFYYSKILFPPAAALSVLPFIIPQSDVWRYPLLVVAGAAVFIVSGMIVEIITGKMIGRVKKNVE